MAIEYSTKVNQKIKNKYNRLNKFITEEKSKLQPDIQKIKKYQIELEEIETIKHMEQ